MALHADCISIDPLHILQDGSEDSFPTTTFIGIGIPATLYPLDIYLPSASNPFRINASSQSQTVLEIPNGRILINGSGFDQKECQTAIMHSHTIFLSIGHNS